MKSLESSKSLINLGKKLMKNWKKIEEHALLILKDGKNYS